MALIECPKCGGVVSTKAVACPRCKGSRNEMTMSQAGEPKTAAESREALADELGSVSEAISAEYEREQANKRSQEHGAHETAPVATTTSTNKLLLWPYVLIGSILPLIFFYSRNEAAKQRREMDAKLLRIIEDAHKANAVLQEFQQPKPPPPP